MIEWDRTLLHHCAVVLCPPVLIWKATHVSGHLSIPHVSPAWLSTVVPDHFHCPHVCSLPCVSGDFVPLSTLPNLSHATTRSFTLPHSDSLLFGFLWLFWFLPPCGELLTLNFCRQFVFSLGCRAHLFRSIKSTIAVNLSLLSECCSESRPNSWILLCLPHCCQIYWLKINLCIYSNVASAEFMQWMLLHIETR